MAQTKQAIATNLITGFLGSGKTTAILNLLKQRPAHSNWAVLVNEFGDVGIDAAMLKDQDISDGLFIKEVPGGCICCAAGLPLQIALNLLIKKASPERILIEPTGVGHPKKVLDVLCGEFYKSVLDIKAIICLVEAHKLNNALYLNNETFMDQLNIADVVLANKSDQATEKDLENFYDFFRTYPIAKAHLEHVVSGSFDSKLLDIEHNIERSVDFPNAHKHVPHSEDKANLADHQESSQQASDPKQQYSWQRFENNGQGYYGCGWIFNSAIIFNESDIEDFINSDRFSRVKGIFHTHNGYMLFNRSEQSVSKQACDHTQDSRVEVIETNYLDWDQVEEQLLQCIE